MRPVKTLTCRAAPQKQLNNAFDRFISPPACFFKGNTHGEGVKRAGTSSDVCAESAACAAVWQRALHNEFVPPEAHRTAEYIGTSGLINKT